MNAFSRRKMRLLSVSSIFMNFHAFFGPNCKHSQKKKNYQNSLNIKRHDSSRHIFRGVMGEMKRARNDNDFYIFRKKKTRIRKKRHRMQEERRKERKTHERCAVLLPIDSVAMNFYIE